MRVVLPPALLALTGFACTWTDAVAPSASGELHRERMTDIEACRPPGFIAGELSVISRFETDGDGVATGLPAFVDRLDGSSIGPGAIEVLVIPPGACSPVERYPIVDVSIHRDEFDGLSLPCPEPGFGLVVAQWSAGPPAGLPRCGPQGRLELGAVFFAVSETRRPGSR